MTIAEFHEQLKTKKTSAREAVFSCISEIEKKNRTLHAFLEVFKDDAEKEAHAIDERIAAGETPGPLWGVPIALKDNFLVKGKKVSAGSKILEGYVASYDATAALRLKQAGAVIIGRTNMDESAMGASTENSAYGVSKNPHDHARVPGGSSGGSAIAVAADMAYAALGSDTGGSIRQPAAFCGVVGLKPTYGRVSRSGLIALASSLDHVGPFAKNVQDIEMVFSAIAGKDPLDSTSVDAPSGISTEIRTIGIPREYFADGLDPRINEQIRRIIDRLSKTYQVKEVSLPHTPAAVPSYYIIVPAEASSNLARFDGIRYGTRKNAANGIEVYKKTRGLGFGTEVTRRVLLGTYVLSHGYYDAYYTQAQKVRSLIADDFKKAFTEVDVLLTPTTPTLPFKIGEKSADPVAMYLSDVYTAPADLAGVPAMSMSVGWVEEGSAKLPVGMQLIAPHFCEDRLFVLGKEIEFTLLNNFKFT